MGNVHSHIKVIFWGALSVLLVGCSGVDFSSGENTFFSLSANISSDCTNTINQGDGYDCQLALKFPDDSDPKLANWSLSSDNECRWLKIDSQTGNVTGSPNDDSVGTCALKVQVEKGGEFSAPTNFSLTVVNKISSLDVLSSPRIASHLPNQKIFEDGEVQADEEGFGTYSIAPATNLQPNCLDSNPTVTIDPATGAVEYTPASNFFGECFLGITFDDENPGGVITKEISVRIDAGATLDLDFRDGILPNEVNYVRAGTGAMMNSQGLIQFVAADTPRFEFDPVTGQSLGLLVEKGATNLIARSLELDDAVTYYTNNATIVANAAISPDGNRNAEALVEDTSNNIHQFGHQFVDGLPNTEYTYSIYLRPDTRQNVYIIVRDGFGGFAFAIFNLLTLGAQVTDDPNNSVRNFGIKRANNGWLRAWVTFNSLGGDQNIAGQVRLTTSAGDLTYQGNGNSRVFIWGNQLEQNSTPTSLIPTQNAAATRGADLISSLNVDWLNSNGGTFSAAYSLNYSASSPEDGHLFSLFADNQNLVSAEFTSSNQRSRFNVINGNVSQGLGEGAINNTDGEVVNFSMAYTTNDGIAFENSAIQSQSNTLVVPANLSTFLIGSDQNQMGQLGGHISKLSYHPERKSNSAIQFISQNFSILGIRGGNDLIADDRLTNVVNTPSVDWEVVNGEKSFEVKIFDSNRTTVKCSANSDVDTTSVTFADCLLTAGNTYWLTINATNDDAGANLSAENNFFKIVVQ